MLIYIGFNLGSRVRYIHCAQGDFVVIGVGADRGVNYTLWRHELAPVAKYCAANLTITYGGDDRINITRFIHAIR